MSRQQREVEYLKICQDKEAYNRFMNIFQKIDKIYVRAEIEAKGVKVKE